MRRILALTGLGLSLLGAAASVSLVGTSTTQAATAAEATFIVPNNDGYGIGECVSTNATCGKVMADAWCEAQGFARSQSYGLIDPADVTGALPGRSIDRPISITCDK